MGTCCRSLSLPGLSRTFSVCEGQVLMGVNRDRDAVRSNSQVQSAEPRVLSEGQGEYSGVQGM